MLFLELFCFIFLNLTINLSTKFQKHMIHHTLTRATLVELGHFFNFYFEVLWPELIFSLSHMT